MHKLQRVRPAAQRKFELGNLTLAADVGTDPWVGLCNLLLQMQQKVAEPAEANRRPTGYDPLKNGARTALSACFEIWGNGLADVVVHAPFRRTLEIVATNALRLARRLKPTTGRYFFWGDDGQPGCLCPKCREFSDSDQALLLENHLMGELRKLDPRAQPVHLACANTLAPPNRVKPESRVFLEFAPIHRPYEEPLAQQAGPGSPGHSEVAGRESPRLSGRHGASPRILAGRLALFTVETSRGETLATVNLTSPLPALRAGSNELRFSCAPGARPAPRVKVTLFTLGEEL